MCMEYTKHIPYTYILCSEYTYRTPPTEKALLAHFRTYVKYFIVAPTSKQSFV
jgi:hypothetical protein